MNLQERIDTLAKQCYSYDHLNFDYNRFAKMIAAECAKVSERTGCLNEADFEGEMIADAIKEHFGVEE